MSKKKKKKKPQNINRSNTAPKIKTEQNEKNNSSNNVYQSDKKLWLRILVLIIAFAMIVGIIIMPFMNIY